MIDRESRNAARTIAHGGPIGRDVNSKVALYGLIGRALDLSSLEEGLALTEAPMNFQDPEIALKEYLQRASCAGFSGLDMGTETRIDELVSERVGAKKCAGGVKFIGLYRIMQGCGTAARTEVTTLRTIVQRQATGEKISEKGLYASAKVPYVVALMHLQNLFIDREHYNTWSVSAGGDGGQVFRTEDVSLRLNSGLSLTNIPEGLAAEEKILAHGPQIGCPATLIEGYMRRVHLIAATAALEASLVEVS